jgi:hypothetical protein
MSKGASTQTYTGGISLKYALLLLMVLGGILVQAVKPVLCGSKIFPMVLFRQHLSQAKITPLFPGLIVRVVLYTYAVTQLPLGFLTQS